MTLQLAHNHCTQFVKSYNCLDIQVAVVFLTGMIVICLPWQVVLVPCNNSERNKFLLCKFKIREYDMVKFMLISRFQSSYDYLDQSARHYCILKHPGK